MLLQQNSDIRLKKNIEGISEEFIDKLFNEYNDITYDD